MTRTLRLALLGALVAAAAATVGGAASAATDAPDPAPRSGFVTVQDPGPADPDCPWRGGAGNAQDEARPAGTL